MRRCVLLVCLKLVLSQVLIDPMCGSGTIAIEAARLKPLAQVFASDRDAGAVEMARRNAARAGTHSIVFSTQSFSGALAELANSEAVAAGARVLVACNPPYGARLSGLRDLRNLYSGLGNSLRPNWRLAFVCGDRVMARLVRPSLASLFETRSGGMPVFGFLAQPDKQ